jgi:hypothetical protein
VITWARRKPRRAGRARTHSPFTQAGREAHAHGGQVTGALDLEVERLGGIQVYGNPQPVPPTLQDLPVGPSQAIAVPQARQRADRARCQLADDDPARLEQGNETQRSDPPQVTGHEQGEIADVGDRDDRDPKPGAECRPEACQGNRPGGAVCRHRTTLPPAGRTPVGRKRVTSLDRCNADAGLYLDAASVATAGTG